MVKRYWVRHNPADLIEHSETILTRTSIYVEGMDAAEGPHVGSKMERILSFCNKKGEFGPESGFGRGKVTQINFENLEVGIEIPPMGYEEFEANGCPRELVYFRGIKRKDSGGMEDYSI